MHRSGSLSAYLSLYAVYFVRLILNLEVGIPPRRHLLELLEVDLAAEAAHVLPHLRQEVPREDPIDIRNLVSIGDDDERSTIRLVIQRSDLELIVELFDVVLGHLTGSNLERLAYVWDKLKRQQGPP